MRSQAQQIVVGNLGWRGPLAFSGALALLVVLGDPAPCAGGTYVFAGETYGTNLVTHPTGYNGTGGVLTVGVCIDPASPNAAAMVNPVQNMIAIYNQRQPHTGNVLYGADNEIGATQMDWESVALHELGHCIGLAHVNLASESGLSDPEANYTKSTDGANNVWDYAAGADGVVGSSDDVRGDDINLHWFRISNNNPFTIDSPVDSTTYSNNVANLPGGHNYAANGDYAVSTLLGVPSSEAVLQQGSYYDEAQRSLIHDDVATLSYAMSGVDELASTADDYTLNLVYQGLTTSCDVVLAFNDAETGFAVCQTGGMFIAADHAAITSANIYFNTGFNWYFNPVGPCVGSHSLTVDQWRMISLPCDVGASDTVSDVLGDDLNPADYNTRWTVYERDEVNQQYVQLALTDSLEEGRGYWIKTLDSGQTVDLDGLFNAELDVALTSDASNGRSNLLGLPHGFNVDWADVLVVDGGSVLTLAEADPVVGIERACSMEPPDASCVMSRVGYRWTGAAYESFDGETPGAEGTLAKFDGVWVKAFKSGISLRIPQIRSTGAKSAGPKSRARNQPWHGRLIVEAAGMRDAGNVFGQLADSVRGHDRHDLREMPPTGDKYLTVVFPHPNWGDRSGDYTTDFHDLGQGNRDVWKFEVRASKVTGPVVLRWEVPELEGRRMVIRDEETGRTIAVRPGGSYRFEMSSGSRAFTWKVRTLK